MGLQENESTGADEPTPEIVQGAMHNENKVGGGYYYAHEHRGIAAPAPEHKVLTADEKAKIDVYYEGGEDGMSKWNTGYHWEERNMMPWAKRRFEELLQGSTEIKKGLTLSVTSVDLDGHVTSAIRKCKKLIGYELSIAMHWEVTLTEAKLKQSFTLNGKLVTQAPGLEDEIPLEEVKFDSLEDQMKLEGEIPMETSLKKREVMSKVVKSKGTKMLQAAMKTFVE